MAQPPAAALDAILAATSVLSHRVEIYEADGVTKWNAGNEDDRLIEGSVSVDYSRDERRSLELRLDNSDFGLEHTPTKFWYDKILKPFYGCKYVEAVAVNSYTSRINQVSNPTFKATSGTIELYRNLVPGGFSADSNADGIADGWSAFSAGTTGTVTRSLVSGAQKVATVGLGSTTSDRVGITLTDYTTVAYNATTLPKATWTADIKGSLPNSQTIVAQIQFFDAANASTGNAITSITSAQVNNTTYTSLSGTLTSVPVNTTKAKFVIYLQGNGTSGDCEFTIDNLIVQTVYNTATTVSLRAFFDGSTVDLTDQQTASWTGTANASASIITGPDIATGPVKTQSNHIAVGWQSDSAGVYRVLARQAIANVDVVMTPNTTPPPVAPGQYSAYRIKVRRVSSSGTVSIFTRHRYFDATNNILTGTLASSTQTIPADGSWLEFSVPSGTTAAPANTASARISLQLTCNEGTIIEIKEGIVEVVSGPSTTAGDYFTGSSTPFGNRTYSWFGAADTTRSTETVTSTTYLNQLTTWETQLGEFMIDRIAEAHFPYSVSVTARDYTKKLLLSKFAVTTAFASGTAIESAIQTIALNGGITKFLLPITGHSLGKDYYFERGVSRWEAIKQITDAFGYEIFFDAQGYLVMREYQDPVTAPFATLLATGPTIGNLITYEKSLNDSRIYNKIVVTGESTDADVPPVYAIATNTEPSSPTRIAAIGERLYQYTSSFITTVLQAQDVADKFLKLHALEEFDLNFEAIAYPWLDVGEIVQFADPRPSAGQPDRFLLSSLTVPLGLGGMSGNAKRVTVVG